MNIQKKRLAYNTIASLLLQITTVLCGFIVPRLILGAYGSDVNGLTNSITQFLGVISLLDLGVGTVVQSALYKPLYEKDMMEISAIYKSATIFFKRIAFILIIYMAILVFLFPRMINNQFNALYTGTLIFAMGFSTFSQYYFGIVNSLLLCADQKGYIQYSIQIFTLILNAILCFVFIKLGYSIQVVKLVTSVVFFLRPFLMECYIRKNYNIDRNIKYNKEPITQKWNGIAQHLASFVLTSTDNIVLTIFSTLGNVSIYSVYNLVVNGVMTIISSLSNGFYAFFGDLWAKNEKETLKKEFDYFEWLIHFVSVIIFSATASLLIDFVKVYTLGIDDTNYIQPIFAFILTIAYGARSLRLPYNFLILAANRYKETQSNYIVAMGVNILLSILFVKKFGLIGVAIGTLIAMVYQTVWMAIYDYNKLIQKKLMEFVKLIFLDIMIFGLSVLGTYNIKLQKTTYLHWGIKAIIVVTISLLISIILNSILYKEYLKKILRFIKRDK